MVRKGDGNAIMEEGARFIQKVERYNRGEMTAICNVEDIVHGYDPLTSILDQCKHPWRTVLLARR